MKAFAANGYLLRYAKLDVRLVYTGFLLLVLIGMVSMGAFQWYHIGPTPSRAAAYYRGGESGSQIMFAKTFRELMEVTHFHAFIMGIVYLVLAHLFLATRIGAGLKRGLIIAGLAGLGGDLISPWLIRYVSGAFAYLQLASWLTEWVSFGAFIAIPIREMWFSREAEEFPPE